MTRCRARFPRLLALALAGLSLLAAAGERAPLGSVAGAFSVKDIRYVTRTLADYGRPKAWVFVFVTTECPLARRYLPRLQELARENRARGVQFLAVNVGPDDSIKDMARQALEQAVDFPFVKDFRGECAQALGARRTPEVVVLDDAGKIRYRGRIDDQHFPGGSKPAPERHDLREAIDDVLAGREVRVGETAVDGCAITVPEPRTDPSLTYARDVAPILNRHCVECHRPGTAAPFVLTAFEKVAAKAAAIAEVVEEQRMPPWFPHPAFGKFANERGLTARERDIVVQWARGGRAPGDLSQAPATPVFLEEKWLIGEPDLVLTAVAEERLPAQGFIPYRYVALPHVFAADTWVQGIQILPSNPRVVHHANLAHVSLAEKFDQDRNFLTGIVPGGIPVQLDSGCAMMIPRGSALGLQVHYVTTGKEETDRISVGLRFAREPVRKRVRYKILGDYGFAIPPGAPAHPVNAARTLETDVTGIGLFSHMHLRGKDSTFIARYPDGKSETLLCLPNYSFDWQVSYVWPRDTRKFPKGTRLECRSHFDNSSFNPFNPDPRATVRNGPQTHDEMMQAFFFYTEDAENLGLRIDPKTGRALAPGP